MAIFRNKQKHFFASVDANIVRTNALSLGALGLMTVLLDRPVWWEVRTAEIARTLAVEPHVLEPLFSELERKGYLKRRSGEKGVYYDVYECPEPVPAPAPDKPAPKPEPKLEPLPELPKSGNLVLNWPDPPEPGKPMTDRNRAYALSFIREHFPVQAKRHDLNDAICDA